MDGILKKQGMSQGTVGERMSALGKQQRFRFEDSDAGRAKLMSFLKARVADMRRRSNGMTRSASVLMTIL